jgi:hypothetical protein
MLRRFLVLGHRLKLQIYQRVARRVPRSILSDVEGLSVVFRYSATCADSLAELQSTGQNPTFYLLAYQSARVLRRGLR